MKPIFEESIEQITGKSPTSKPQLTTSGLKEALDPGKMMADAMKQALGFGEKKIPTKEELEQRTNQDSQNTQAEISKIKEDLGIETPSGGQPQQPQKQPMKGNIAVIHPSKTASSQPPAYISGKPGLKTPEEQVSEQERKKKELPPLQAISTKPQRGSSASVVNRKKKGMEIKGGRE